MESHLNACQQDSSEPTVAENSDATAVRTPAKRLRTLQSDGHRTSNACLMCRQKKVKCDGQHPCKYCVQRGLDCAFSSTDKRRLFSISQIRELEQKVARYESQEAAHGVARVHDTPQVGRGLTLETQPGEPILPVPCEPDPMARPMTNPLESQSGPTVTSPGSAISASTSARGPIMRAAIAPGSALSSSDTFVSEVRTLLVSRSNAGSAEDTTNPATPTFRSLDVAGLERIPGWPSEAEARELLELVVLNVGISQQLFDIRSFADTLPLLYHGSSGDQPSWWITKALLIMATGRLLQAWSDPGSHIPGESLFNEAIKSVPDLGSLPKHGILGVEVMALSALYLQIADRKEEAYLYASMALRLAVSHGMHKSSVPRLLYSSQDVHRNRLWWTVYMQERRLAAAAGYPLTVHDRAITVAPPEDALGFPSAAAIALNVRAARITGQITWTIYCQTSTSEASFIADVQNILHSLDDLERSMPAEYVMDFSQPEMCVGGRPFSQWHVHAVRTSSSLYLSVFQAAIYAVRPILLHMARKSRDNDMGQQGGDPSPAVRRLGEICVEAASKSLLILQELRRRELIAKHAFLDLDALFSVGFVFVLVEIISPGRDLGAPGIEISRSILRYLVQLGNRAASKRLAELDQMCQHLGLPPRQGSEASLQTRRLSQVFSFERGYHNPETLVPASQTTSVEVRPTHGYSNNVALDSSNELAPQVAPQQFAPHHDPFPNQTLSNISLEGEDDLFWVFQPGLYTGAEIADWETLEQHTFDDHHS